MCFDVQSSEFCWVFMAVGKSMSIDLYPGPTYQELQGSLGCHDAGAIMVKNYDICYFSMLTVSLTREFDRKQKTCWLILNWSVSVQMFYIVIKSRKGWNLPECMSSSSRAQPDQDQNILINLKFKFWGSIWSTSKHVNEF